LGDLPSLKTLLQTTKTKFENANPKGLQTFQEILKSAPEYQITRAQFRQRLNRIWTSRFTSDLLDTDPRLIQYKLLSAFYEFTYRANAHVLSIALESYRGILEDPVIKAMFDEGMLFNLSFESALRFRTTIDYFHAQDYLQETLASMTKAQRIHYRLWRFRKGFFFFRIERQRIRSIRGPEVLEPKIHADLEIDAHPPAMTFKEMVEMHEHKSDRRIFEPGWALWLPSFWTNKDKKK
jgi:hypothetical protein